MLRGGRRGPSGHADFECRRADRAKPTPYPNAWRIRELTLAAIPLGTTKMIYAMTMLALGWFWAGLDAETMRSLTFLTLVLGGQATNLVLREREHVWRSRPGGVLLAAMAVAAAVATTFAGRGGAGSWCRCRAGCCSRFMERP